MSHQRVARTPGTILAVVRPRPEKIIMELHFQSFEGGHSRGMTARAACVVSGRWDTDLMHAWGVAMGKEFYDMGANVQLGPGVCVARVPRNGQNATPRRASPAAWHCRYHLTDAILTVNGLSMKQPR